MSVRIGFLLPQNVYPSKLPNARLVVSVGFFKSKIKFDGKIII